MSFPEEGEIFSGLRERRRNSPRAVEEGMEGERHPGCGGAQRRSVGTLPDDDEAATCSSEGEEYEEYLAFQRWKQTKSMRKKKRQGAGDCLSSGAVTPRVGDVGEATSARSEAEDIALLAEAAEGIKVLATRLGGMEEKAGGLSHPEALEGLVREGKGILSELEERQSRLSVALSLTGISDRGEAIKALQQIQREFTQKVDGLEARLNKKFEGEKILEKEVDAKVKGMEVDYQQILQMFPQSTEEGEFFEVDQMQKQLGGLQLEQKWADFKSKTESLRAQLGSSNGTGEYMALLTEMTKSMNEFKDTLSSARSSTEHIIKNFGMTKEGRLAREVKKESKHLSNLGQLAIFKLPIKRDFQDNKNMFRHFSVGPPAPPDVPVKIIIIITTKTGTAYTSTSP